MRGALLTLPERMQRVHTLRYFGFPSTIARTRWMLGSHRRLLHLLLGGSDGLTADGDQIWNQNSPGVEGAAESGDYFGRALASADFNDDGHADLLIGAALRTGERALHIVSRDMVRSMQPGSVIVDVAVDQGGCIETTRPTTYDAPTYVDEGVLHFCVTNMPGAVQRFMTRSAPWARKPG